MQKSKKPSTIKKANCPFLLPKGYLSWSALELWENNPREFAEVYFKNKRKFETPEMAFGKKVHKALETKTCDDKAIQTVIQIVTCYKNHEVECYTIWKSKYGDIPLYALIDNLEFESKDFKDFKTGKTPWDQKRADKHGQLAFYALVLESLTQRRPKKAGIVWLETTGQSEKIRLTGNVQEFHVEITEKHLEGIKKRILDACMGIDKAYKQYLSTSVNI